VVHSDHGRTVKESRAHEVEQLQVLNEVLDDENMGDFNSDECFFLQ
jgi:hypothetical protein